MSEDNPREKITILGDDGIHKLIRRQRLNEDGTPKEWTGDPENLFWGYIEELMQECAQTLEQSELPNPDQIVWFVTGLGWLLKGKEPANDAEREILLIASKQRPDGERLWKDLGKPQHGQARGDNYAQIAAKPYSEEWYAGEILHLCTMITSNRESTYARHLGRIYKIAEFEKDREWRRDFGMMIRRDINGQKARSAGGQAKKANFARRTVQILMSMNEMKNKGIPIYQAAGLTFKNGLGSSQGANQKLWTRNKHILTKSKT